MGLPLVPWTKSAFVDPFDEMAQADCLSAAEMVIAPEPLWPSRASPVPGDLTVSSRALARIHASSQETYCLPSSCLYLIPRA